MLKNININILTLNKKFKMGASMSSNFSSDYFRSQSDVMQKYRGTCKATCTNIMSDIAINLKDTIVKGGINFEQVCTTDAKCVFNTALADVSKAVSNVVKEQKSCRFRQTS